MLHAARDLIRVNPNPYQPLLGLTLNRNQLPHATAAARQGNGLASAGGAGRRTGGQGEALGAEAQPHRSRFAYSEFCSSSEALPGTAPADSAAVTPVVPEVGRTQRLQGPHLLVQAAECTLDTSMLLQQRVTCEGAPQPRKHLSF